MLIANNKNKNKSCSLHGVWTAIDAFRCVLRFRADLLAMSHAGWMDYASCLSATEWRMTTAKRDDLHSNSLFFVKKIKDNGTQKAVQRERMGILLNKISERLDLKWERAGRNLSNFAHTHTHAAKLVVRIMSTTSGRGRGSRPESRYTQTRPSRLGTSETRPLEPVRISLMSWAEPKYIDIHRFVPTLVPPFFFFWRFLTACALRWNPTFNWQIYYHCMIINILSVLRNDAMYVYIITYVCSLYT